MTELEAELISDFDTRKFVEEHYEPVEDKPGYVWFSKRKMQIIRIDLLVAYLEERGYTNNKKCQLCENYKDGYCEELELKPCYPEKGCDYFSRQLEQEPYGSDFLNKSLWFITQEEAITELKAMPINYPLTNAEDRVSRLMQARDMAIKALEQKPYDFAKWVAEEIFDENWEYNKEAFAELACRKLAKLGIVIRMGDEWELVESEGEK